MLQLSIWIAGLTVVAPMFTGAYIGWRRGPTILGVLCSMGTGLACFTICLMLESARGL